MLYGATWIRNLRCDYMVLFHLVVRDVRHIHNLPHTFLLRHQAHRNLNPTPVIQPGLPGLLMLILTLDFKGLPEMSALSIRYCLRKLCSSLVKMKGHAVFYALDMGIDDPAVVTGPCLRSGFTAAGNGFQDAASIGIP